VVEDLASGGVSDGRPRLTGCDRHNA